MSNINLFLNNITSSMNDSNLPLYNEVYKGYFSDFSCSINLNNNIEYQTKSVDRIIQLNSGKEIFIEEKLRWKKFDDFLIEEFSSFESATPGWINKDIHADYILYVIKPLKKSYLIPTQLLKKAWEVNKDKWKSQYHRIEAKNKTYTSINWAIPINVLMLSLAVASIGQFA